ncbi:MAG: dockerin type I repeat-containing protein [candidate division Zixibacteria bacterium]|nr:dockerin type I repeat-containing protein [candidate division Zixibacteria bacterium]
MKHSKLLISLILVTIVFASANAGLVIRYDISGPGSSEQNGIKYIIPNTQFFVDVYAANTDRRTVLNLPLVFSGTGDVTNAQWYCEGGEVQCYNWIDPEFRGRLDLFSYTLCVSWDGDLTDEIIPGEVGDFFNLVGVSGENDSDCFNLDGQYHRILHCGVKIPADSGAFCIDTGSCGNPVYNWYFEDPQPTFEGGNSKACWELANIPTVISIAIDGHADTMHLINHNPEIGWSYLDLKNEPQREFQIQFGIDTNWSVAELWDPLPFQSSDSAVAYAGAVLGDGLTYFYRLRVKNNNFWSNWYQTSFRMNSVPSVPTHAWPENNAVSNIATPILCVHNATDAENDNLTYDYEVVNDSAFGDLILISDSNIAQASDSTGWTVNEPLMENWKYWWRSRSFDQFEKSNWSDNQSIWVNEFEESPLPFDIVPLADIGGKVFNMLPQFSWGLSFDPDPLDSIHYCLEVAIDSNFHFAYQIDSIWINQYNLADSLEFGMHYWWRVEAVDNTALPIYSTSIHNFRTWKLGDANGDWLVNIQDITFVINHLYPEGSTPPPPAPIYVGDVNGDCLINIRDITYLINFLYKAGPAPKIGCM